MPENINQWLSAINTTMIIGTMFYAWITRSGKEAGEKVVRVEHKVEEAIKDRDRKIDVLEDRISRIEGELRHLPDRATVHRMELSITEMKGDMKAIVERLTPVAAIADRLQEFLLEQAKGPR